MDTRCRALAWLIFILSVLLTPDPIPKLYFMQKITFFWHEISYYKSPALLSWSKPLRFNQPSKKFRFPTSRRRRRASIPTPEIHLCASNRLVCWMSNRIKLSKQYRTVSIHSYSSHMLRISYGYGVCMWYIRVYVCDVTSSMHSSTAIDSPMTLARMQTNVPNTQALVRMLHLTFSAGATHITQHTHTHIMLAAHHQTSVRDAITHICTLHTHRPIHTHISFYRHHRIDRKQKKKKKQQKKIDSRSMCSHKAAQQQSSSNRTMSNRFVTSAVEEA